MALIANMHAGQCRACGGHVHVGAGVASLDRSDGKWVLYHRPCFPSGEGAALAALEKSVRSGDVVVYCAHDLWAVEIVGDRTFSGGGPGMVHWVPDDLQTQARKLATLARAMDSIGSVDLAGRNVVLVVAEPIQLPKRIKARTVARVTARRFQSFLDALASVRARCKSFRQVMLPGKELRRLIQECRRPKRRSRAE